MRSELIFLALAGSLFIAAAAVDAYNTEQHLSNEDTDAVTRDHESRENRLGYATLINAGYADVTMPAEGMQDGVSDFNVTPREANPELRCASRRLTAPAQLSADAAIGKVNGLYLLAALLAAEKYNRTAVTRKIEGLWARAVFKLTGSLPDLSLGLAQIRPSAIQAALAQAGDAVPLTDEELLDMALDDCSNVFAASLHLIALLGTVDGNLPRLEIVAAAARTYNGGDNPVYVDAVTGAYRLLDPDGPASAAPDAAPPPSLDICATFEAGMPVGELALGGYTEPQQIAIGAAMLRSTAIRILLVDHQPGPASYLQRLADLRRQWLNTTFAKFGIPPEVMIYETTQDPISDCEDLASAAFARLRITLPAGFQMPADPANAPAPDTEAPAK